MDDRRAVKISKYLAKHLRHQPERIGITLDPHGWVEISVLLAASSAHTFRRGVRCPGRAATRHNPRPRSPDLTPSPCAGSSQGHRESPSSTYG